MEEERMDQSAVATTVSEGIKYEFLDDFLVKPLDPVMVKKEFNTPVSKGEPTEKDGIVAEDYDEVATEVKEVESDYREGVVLKVPTKYQAWMNDEKAPTTPINIGDIVVFPAASASYFDLVKDTARVKPYNIVAIKRS